MIKTISQAPQLDEAGIKRILLQFEKKALKNQVGGENCGPMRNQFVVKYITMLGREELPMKRKCPHPLGDIAFAKGTGICVIIQKSFSP
jgi:hypothetical protein